MYLEANSDAVRVILPVADLFKSILECLFVRSWDTYLVAHTEKKRTLEAQAFIEHQLKESATADVAADLTLASDRSYGC